MTDLPNDPEITPELWSFVKANFRRPRTDRAFYTLMAILEGRRREVEKSPPTPQEGNKHE